MKSFSIRTTAVCFLLTSSLCFAKQAPTIRTAVLREIQKYPELQIQDLYKLAYQAAMGNEHSMGDLDSARKYLLDELAIIDTLAQESLIEYLTSDSTIARIHLRTFKKQKQDPQKLLRKMTETASAVRPSTDLLRNYWNEIETLAEDGTIPFKKNDLAEFFKIREKENFPAMHHSSPVTAQYHPAYRVVAGPRIAF